jgi:hypothetical protein
MHLSCKQEKRVRLPGGAYDPVAEWLMLASAKCDFARFDSYLGLVRGWSKGWASVFQTDEVGFESHTALLEGEYGK